jgi:hypothetical protein
MIRKDYTFNAVAKTITFADPIVLEQLGIITNIVDGVRIYNPMDASASGTLSGQVLTLTYDTSSMSNSDKLQVFYGEEEGLSGILFTITRLLKTIARAFNIVTTGTGRLSVDVNSVTGTVGTVTTVTGVTTVTTLTNQTNVGGVNAFELQKAMSRTAFATSVRPNLN